MKITKPKYKTIEISAKCSDLFSAQVKDAENNTLIDYDGYVPNFFPDDHYGDYIMLNIDINTGKILNWKKPSEKQLNLLKATYGRKAE